MKKAEKRRRNSRYDKAKKHDRLEMDIMTSSAVQKTGSYLGAHWLVHRTPPDILLGRVLFHDTLVAG